MTPEELQKAIDELAEFPTRPEAGWVEKFRKADMKALVGVILHWLGHGGVMGGPDPHASRREAAQALLQIRLLNNVESAASGVETSVEDLHNTIGKYERASQQQAKSLARMTTVIVWLTAVMLLAVLAQIGMAVFGK